MRRTVSLLLALSLWVAPARGAGRPSRVVDARLAVLRSTPSLTAPLLKRLRVGRRVYEVGRRRDAEGRAWVRVAVTRRTRGWILAEAVAKAGDADAERRVETLLAALDGIPRVEVARVAADHFPHLRARARAVLVEEARSAAEELTERANRRLGPLEGATPEQVRALMLSDPGLDRYNRLGVLFDVDAAARRYATRP
jgi:hypothetical protein